MKFSFTSAFAMCELLQGLGFKVPSLARSSAYCTTAWSTLLSEAQSACRLLQEGDESYPLYKKEREGLLSSLKKRATMIENVSGWLHSWMTAEHELLGVKRADFHNLCMNAHH